MQGKPAYRVTDDAAVGGLPVGEADAAAAPVPSSVDRGREGRAERAGAERGTGDDAVSLARPRRWAAPLRLLMLGAADLAGVAVAAALAYALWAGGRLGQPKELYLGLLPALLAFPVAYAAARLYPGFGIGAVDTLRRFSLATSLVFVGLAATSFAFKVGHEYSRMTFAIAWLGCLLTVPAARYAALVVARRWRWWLEPALAAGNAGQIGAFAVLLESSLSLGYRLVGRLAEPGVKEAPGAAPGPPVVGHLGDAPRLGGSGFRALFLVFGDEARERALFSKVQGHFRHVFIVHALAGLPVEGVVVRDFGGALGMEFVNRLLQRRNRVVKRTMDLALGGLALVAAAPLIALGAVAVKLASPGPALFSQVRAGRGGRNFRLWKLRTMVADADERLREHLAATPAAREEWERAFKLRDDPRIVPVVGRFLRRFSLDELPQLWNVVRGDMSLVGPRPFPEYHLATFSPEFQRLRSRVRPGLTGLWQVTVRSAGGLEEQQNFDSHYIWNWSVWLDLHILLRTARVVLRGDGAF